MATVLSRIFNRPEFSRRHDFQAKKFGRQCTKSGSHAVGLQEKKNKNKNKQHLILVALCKTKVAVSGSELFTEINMVAVPGLHEMK